MNWDLVRVVDEQQVRGVIEHFYRAVESDTSTNGSPKSSRARQ